MSSIFMALSRPRLNLNWAKSITISSIPCKSTTAKETERIDTAIAIADPEELEEKKKLSTKITVPVKVDLSPVSGIPSTHIKTRRVCIHLPPKNAMQSGTNNVHHWQISFDNRARWENPLMGWTSTGDPLSNMQIEFNSKEEAINHCERNGWKWFIQGEYKPKKERVKNYGVNFSWNRRTRVSTK